MQSNKNIFLYQKAEGPNLKIENCLWKWICLALWKIFSSFCCAGGFHSRGWVVFADGCLGSQQWRWAVSAGEGKSPSLCPCKPPSLPPWPLCTWDHWISIGWKRKLIDTHQTGHLVHQIPEILLLSGCPMVEIYVEHKYLHMQCPFLGVTYSPPPLDLLATIFPILFFPKTWPSGKPFEHCSWIIVDSHMKPSLLAYKVDN